jgi:Xaa-Pro aminopeptidase
MQRPAAASALQGILGIESAAKVIRRNRCLRSLTRRGDFLERSKTAMLSLASGATVWKNGRVMRSSTLPAKLFVENRARLRELLLPNSLVIVNANDVPATNGDGTLPLVQNSDLLYFTGVAQEETILMLFPSAFDQSESEILFLRETNEQIETWEGRRLTKEEARAATGIANVRWLSEFPRLFRQHMCDCEHVYLNTNEHRRAQPEIESRDARFICDVQRRYPLHSYQRLARLTRRLRAVKSPLEIDAIRKACAVTEQAFRKLLTLVRPGVSEKLLAAELAREFIHAGAGFAYEPIIASGANSCVLHYVQNDQVCRRGTLLLLDIGARHAHYPCDLSRTVPVSGRFTKRQRQVYRAVLRVLREAMSAAVPGRLPREWQEQAESAMEKELVDLGLLTMNEIRKQTQERKAVKKYFMHGIGHPLGLDVHDVAEPGRPFEPGFVMTVEPGIYIREEGFGIRIENDIVVTENAPVDLMKGIPIEPEEIEELMQR